MTQLDRFQPVAEPDVAVMCVHCFEDIYVGDEAASVAGENYTAFVHDGCELAYLRNLYVLERGVINADRTID